MSDRKLRKELVECAKALLEINLNSPPELIQELVEDARFHLEWLKADIRDPSKARALDQRILRALDILDDIERQRTAW